MQLPSVAFSFVLSCWKACSIKLRTGHWLCQWKISHFFTLKNSLAALADCFAHYPFALWNTFYSLIHFQISSFYFCHVITLPPSCLIENVVVFWIMSRFSPPYISLLIILVQVHIDFSLKRCPFLFFLLAKCILILLFLSLTSSFQYLKLQWNARKRL